MPGLLDDEIHPAEMKSSLSNIQFTYSDDENQLNNIQLSTDLLFELFPNIDENMAGDKYVAIKPLGSPLFNFFKTYKIQSHPAANLPLNTVNFTNHSDSSRKLCQSTIEKCLVMTTNPVELSKIIVSAPPEIYYLLQLKSSKNAKRIISTSVGLHNIARLNDTIRDINCKIILCEPVNQGLLVSETKIIIVKDDDYKSTTPEKIQTINDDDTLINTTEVLSSCLDSGSLFMNKNSKPLKLKVKPILAPMSEIATNLPHGADDTIFALVKNDVLLKLGIFNGSLVQIVTKNGTESEPKTRTVRLFSIIEPNNARSNTIFLSPILIYNIGTPEEVSVKKLHRKISGKEFKVTDKISLARVSSPITLDRTYQHVFLTKLKSYFQNCTRIVKLHDLIPIPIDSILCRTLFDTYSQYGEESFPKIIPCGSNDSIAWFKVISIDNSSDEFIVDSNKTELTQSGSISEKLPPNESISWYEHFNLPPVFDYNSIVKSKNDSGKDYFQYALSLKRLIHSSLNSTINLKSTILLSSLTRGVGKSSVVKNLTTELGVNLLELDCYDVLNPGSDMKVIGTIRGKLDKLVSSCHKDGCVVFLKHIEALCVKSDPNQQAGGNKNSISLKMIELINEYLALSKTIIIMTCNDVDKLNDSIRSIIKFEINIGVPSEMERIEIFKHLLTFDENNVNSINTETLNFEQTKFIKRDDINYQTLSLQSAGLTPRDLRSIVENTKISATERLQTLSDTSKRSVTDLLLSSGGIVTLNPQDFETAINDARNKFSDSVGAPRIPNVKWEDIGGLDLVKDEILDTIDMPLKHPELFNNGIKKRSGILFYGPPGTGKTLLAKAIATNFSLNFFSVKGPELLNMYIGESEANVRRVFQKARDAKPCVIFFDELDSVAPKRGNQGDSGGVMDRIVSQLLAELDGMSGTDGGDGVFVVGATNRPDLLDEALLRPGRFDKMLYLGIADTDDKQKKILEALTRKFTLDPKINLTKIAESCTFNFTGADFYALCSDAMLNAMTRTANSVDIKINAYNQVLPEEKKVSTRWWFDNVANSADINVIVTEEDFLKARNCLTPSVSAEELQHYLRVRENFEGKSKENNELNGK